MRKGQVSIFILVGLFLVATLVLLAWLSSNNSTVEPKDCAVAADCVPAECCDSDLCVPKSEAPDCGQFTTKTSDDVECFACTNWKDNSTGCDDPFTGIGKGSCNCVDQKCKPVWPEG